MRKIEEIKSNWKSVFLEDFSTYEEGPFSDGYDASAEFHYPLKKVDMGPWEEISKYHLWGKSHNPGYPNWRILREKGTSLLKQTLVNPLMRSDFKHFIKKAFFRKRLPILLAFPALVTGDSGWEDLLFSARVRPLFKNELVGLLFRVIGAQQQYIFGLKKDSAYLLRREHNELHVISRKRFAYDPGKDYTFSVLTQGMRIRCFVNQGVVLDMMDETFSRGKVGLMANVPAVFTSAEIFTPSKSVEGCTNVTTATPGQRTHKGSIDSGKIELWRKLPVKNLCSGRSIRFGDLDGDGQVDLLLAQGSPILPGNGYNSISCLTAINLDGDILWQRGLPSDQRICLHSDLAFQIYDIDGDGLPEVLCTFDGNLEILDGRNGELKSRIPTPRSASSQDKCPRILGDAIYICNVSGKERPQDILLKDRYEKIWAYDSNLHLLWEYQSKGEMGHFPYSIDINNDGREEVLVGYSLLGSDGKRIWELPLRDHADAVAIVKDEAKGVYKVLIAASDEGFIIADIKGKIEKHLRLGHMQTVTVARLIPDSSDYQIATNTYWGNPGIIYVLDLEGNIITTFQPSLYGSPLCPVNWNGGSHALLLLSAAPDETGGLYDGLGNQVVAFPDDGHPLLCYDAFDFDGDGLDELICWDHEELWIYTWRDKSADREGRHPKRFPPPYNASNYRANTLI